jgi:hypothetical protein
VRHRRALACPRRRPDLSGWMVSSYAGAPALWRSCRLMAHRCADGGRSGAVLSWGRASLGRPRDLGTRWSGPGIDVAPRVAPGQEMRAPPRAPLQLSPSCAAVRLSERGVARPGPGDGPTAAEPDKILVETRSLDTTQISR